MKNHWKKRQLDTKKIRINRGYQMQEMEGAVTYDNDNRSENKYVLTNDFWHKCTHTKTQGHTETQKNRHGKIDRQKCTDTDRQTQTQLHTNRNIETHTGIRAVEHI